MFNQGPSSRPGDKVLVSSGESRNDSLSPVSTSQKKTTATTKLHKFGKMPYTTKHVSKPFKMPKIKPVMGKWQNVVERQYNMLLTTDSIFDNEAGGESTFFVPGRASRFVYKTQAAPGNDLSSASIAKNMANASASAGPRQRQAARHQRNNDYNTFSNNT